MYDVCIKITNHRHAIPAVKKQQHRSNRTRPARLLSSLLSTQHSTSEPGQGVGPGPPPRDDRGPPFGARPPLVFFFVARSVGRLACWLVAAIMTSLCVCNALQIQIHTYDCVCRQYVRYTYHKTFLCICVCVCVCICTNR